MNNENKDQIRSVFLGRRGLAGKGLELQEGLDRTRPLELFPKGFKGFVGEELKVVLGSGHFFSAFLLGFRSLPLAFGGVKKPAFI